MQELVAGIFTWHWFSEPHGYNFNGYLVTAPGGNVCIDPVVPSDADLAFLLRRGVSFIALTNRNHVRAANQVRAATGARTLIHRADAAYARQQGADIDEEVQVADRIGPFVAVGAAGKSPGEIALHWPQRRLLVVGDAVVGKPPGHCAFLPDRVMDDPARLRASVGDFLALDFDVLLVGDGEPILSGARDRLRELIHQFQIPDSKFQGRI